MDKRFFLIVVIGVVGFYGTWGLGWGLPSAARADLFLRPEQKNMEFYARVAAARDEMYQKIGGNIVSYFGRTDTDLQQANPHVTLMNSYSSYLTKTHAMDEAGTLVLLSRINPLKNKWYPQSFVYGGAYLYPLSFSLGVAHVLHVIRLVPSVTHYYANPDQMAGLYLVCRIFAVLGLLTGTVGVYVLGQSLYGTSVGLWAAVFFGLAPTCIAHAKFAKPHTWSAALSLWMIVFALRAKASPKTVKLLATAAVFLGLAMGMTVTQVVFMPFLLWAAWSPDWRVTLKRGFIACAIVGSLYVLSNFYIPFYWQEYRDEQAFLSRFSPFQVRVSSVIQFLTGVFRISLGWELWALAVIGWGWALIQKNARMLRELAALFTIAFVYVSFQMQTQSMLPLTSRLLLGMIGLLALFGSAASFQWGRLGLAIRSLCLAALLMKGGIYNGHFASDRAPFDNASLASQWIHQNVKPQTPIAQSQYVPHVDFFPPIDFASYNIIQISSAALDAEKTEVYAAISEREIDARRTLVEKGFTLVQQFKESPLQKRGYSDPFTNANFGVEIYRRPAR